MKKMMKAVCFFTILAFQAFANESKCLQDACGYVALTPAHIEGLYSWNESQKVCIGVDETQQSGSSHTLAAAQNSGLILEDRSDFFQNDSTKHLSAISFEVTEESFSKRHLVAECEGLKRGRAKIVRVNELPASRQSTTAMGASKPK